MDLLTGKRCNAAMALDFGQGVNFYIIITNFKLGYSLIQECTHFQAMSPGRSALISPCQPCISYYCLALTVRSKPFEKHDDAVYNFHRGQLNPIRDHSVGRSAGKRRNYRTACRTVIVIDCDHSHSRCRQDSEWFAG